MYRIRESSTTGNHNRRRLVKNNAQNKKTPYKTPNKQKTTTHMKKVVLLLLALMLSISTVKAQKVINMNREFSVTGTLKKYCVTEELDGLINVKKGVNWHLENSPYNEQNYIRFWIETPNGEQEEYKVWKGKEIKIVMILNEDGGKNYLIRDDLFQHLIIMQLEEGYLVHNCSVIK